MSNKKYVVKRYNTSPTFLEEYREKYDKINYIQPRRYSNNSRYSTLRTYIDEHSGKSVHESWSQKVINYTRQDQYFTVTKTEENRLDIISNYFYYTGKYWWVIAMANYILDPFDIPVGTYLRIPPINSLYDNGGVLRG